MKLKLFYATLGNRKKNASPTMTDTPDWYRIGIAMIQLVVIVFNIVVS
jgi:hypothetical protein